MAAEGRLCAIAALDHLQGRLEAGEAVVLDGGTGSEIEARGVPMDGEAWSALANLSHPDVVRGVHEDFIRAGAQVVIANTFAAGLAGDRFEEVNRAGVRLAQEAVGGRHVAVAGSLSLMVPPDRYETTYRAQARVLAEAGVDLLALEMMSSLDHALPALAAAGETGLPVWLGVSCGAPGDHGRPVTVRGADLAGFLDELLGSGPPPAAVLVMHTDLDDSAAALDVVAERFAGPLGCYPHW